jgi:hypothetical protein
MKIINIIAIGTLFTSLSSFAESRHADAILVEDNQYKIDAGFMPNDEVYKLPSDRITVYENDAIQNKRGGSLVHVGYLGVESQGRNSDFEYGSSGSGDIHRTSVTEKFADTLLELPDNHTINWIRVWGSDSDAVENLQFYIFEICLPNFSAGALSSTTLADITSSGDSGDWSASVNINPGIEVNNTGCTYVVRTRFDTATNSLRLFKIRAELNPIAPAQ